MYQNIRRFFLPTARCWDADSERSYQDLFERLDTNKDGKVDVAELRAGLKAMGIFRQGAAQVQLAVAMRVLLTAGAGRSSRTWPLSVLRGIPTERDRVATLMPQKCEVNILFY